MQVSRVDILRFQSPLQIEACRVFIFIFDPSPLLQGFLYVAIATLYNEYLCLLIDPILLTPGSHISNIQKDLIRGHISLNKLLESLVIMFHLNYFTRLSRRWRLLLFINRLLFF